MPRYERAEFNNSFQKGMRSDRDPLQQDPQSYRYSLNGRIIFNQGETFAWENAIGNVFDFSLPDGYKAIGAIEMPNMLAILSTNEVNSEIGFLTFDANGIGTYTRVFNDLFDPNGDKFGFSYQFPIRGWAVIESPSKQRIYWTDHHQEMYTFNMVAGLQQNNPEFTQGNYLPLLTGVYPWFYSVQQSQWYTDFKMGIIKFVKTTGSDATPDGSLKTGVFQYTYQLGTREGYWTPFYPLTRDIFLTNIDKSTISNAHEYYMTNSNVTTPYSIQLQIKGVDTRYYYLRVAYVYSIDQDATVESNIFIESKINPSLSPDITIDHRDHSGTPVDIDQYNVYPLFVRRTVDVVEKDQRLWFPNVETDGSYKIDLSTISITPIIRTYTGDKTAAEVAVPLTDTDTDTTTIDVQLYLDNTSTPVNETYQIISDWVTYQGMQFDHLFKGYWRGETYPFGICWYNRKGIPFYVQNLEDFTFPQQYMLDGNGDPYTLTDSLNGNPNDLRIMGAVISGIKFNDAFLYDDVGNLRVSGFSILRCKRKPKVLYQSVIVPTVFCNFISGEEKWTRPMPMPSDSFATIIAQDSLAYDTDYSRDLDKDYGDRPSTFQLHSPEISFQFPVYSQTGQDGLQPSDVIQIISQNQSAYHDVGDCPGDPDLIELYSGTPPYYFYTKQYTTTISLTSTYDMGAQSRIETINAIDFSNSATDPGNFILLGYDPENLPLEFHGQATVFFNDGDCACNADVFDTLAPRGSLLIKSKDFNKAITFAEEDNVDDYYLVNYVAASDQYYNSFNSESIGTRKYIGTGHFQPINQAVLDSVTFFDIDGNRYYQFDGIEVWGGDCYVEFWDYLRLYPRYTDECNTVCTDVYKAYAVGMIVPIESNLNHSMRKGRSFASVAVETQNDACGGSGNTLDGININQPEEFNLNSVLLYQENVQFFPGLPNDLDVTLTQYPNRWIYSEVKFYGELTDQYRRVLANNFGDVIGLYGDLQGGVLWGNQLYSFQPRGWGRLRINDRSIISTQNQEAVQTGAGITYDGIDYFSNTYGTQHIFSLIATEQGFYWVDVINRAIMRYGKAGQEVLSDTREQHSFTNYILDFYDEKTRSIQPYQYRWISAAKDRINGEVIFSFANNMDRPTDPTKPLSTSINFNENLDAFTTFNSFSPVFITQYRQFIYSTDNLQANDVYTHGLPEHSTLAVRGEYYGIIYDSVVETVMNAAPSLEKKIDNAVLNINQGGGTNLVGITLTTDTESFTQGSFQSYSKQIYRRDNLVFAYPLSPTGDRLRGKYLACRYFFSNLDDEVVKFTSARTYFRKALWT